MNRTLYIDIETYSDEDLGSSGVYRYSASPEFRVLLIAWSLDGGPVECVSPDEEDCTEIRALLTDPGVLKVAHNATFERVCLSRWLGLDGFLDPAQWDCTMVAAARMGMPMQLGQCAKVLGIPEQKMTEGKALIRYFSVPGRDGRRHLPSDAPDKWATFREYCKQDVVTEMGVAAKVLRPVIAEERALWLTDQRINDRGVAVDMTLVRAASALDRQNKAGLAARAKALTGLDNPNSPAQIKQWISESTGGAVSPETLTKASLDDLGERLRAWPQCREMIAIRREMGKTSNKKYDAMLGCVCPDGRIHGLLQFYGAARTGRWAGRLVQVQNLPQNHMADLDGARRLVKAGDLATLEMTYDSPSNVLSELVRTAFVAPEGHELHVCDFSAIEARVIAWIAGEEWVLDVFRSGGDIYCATASQMFRCPVEKHGANAHLRARGKVAVLALGYGGGVAALDAMGAGRMGLDEDEQRRIVGLWREANPGITGLWRKVERAARRAVTAGMETDIGHGITYGLHRGALTVKLPSGRVLYYPRARVTGEGLEYEGINQTTKRWETRRTYGGMLVENLVQAVARDILGDVLLRAELKGIRTVFHVHDEIVAEAPQGTPLENLCSLFDNPPVWAQGLPLKGAGYVTPYYIKD